MRKEDFFPKTQNEYPNIVPDYTDLKSELTLRVLEREERSPLEAIFLEKNLEKKHGKISCMNMLVYKFFNPKEVLDEREEDLVSAYSKSIALKFYLSDTKKQPFEIKTALSYFQNMKKDSLEYVNELCAKKRETKEKGERVAPSRIYAREILRKDAHLNVANRMKMGLLSLSFVEEADKKSKDLSENFLKTIFQLLYNLGMSEHIKTPQDVSDIVDKEFERYKFLEKNDLMEKIKNSQSENNRFSESDSISFYESIHNIALPLGYREAMRRKDVKGW